MGLHDFVNWFSVAYSLNNFWWLFIDLVSFMYVGLIMPSKFILLKVQIEFFNVPVDQMNRLVEGSVFIKNLIGGWFRN